MSNNSATILRPDAGRIPWSDLQPEQQDAIRNAASVLSFFVDDEEAQADSVPTHAGDGTLTWNVPYAKVRPPSVSRVVLFDGDRGMGKTTAALTMLNYMGRREPLASTSPASTDAAIEATVRNDLRRYVPVGIVDAQPLPDDAPPELWLLRPFTTFAEHCASHQRENFYTQPGHASEGLLDLSRNLMNAAAGGWAGRPMQRTSSLPEFVTALKERDKLRSSFADLWTRFIDELRKTVRSKSGVVDLPFFAVLVDDVDMNVAKTGQMLELIRLLYHPAVAFMVTANSTLILDALTREHQSAKSRAGSQAYTLVNNPYDDQERAESRHLAHQMLLKLVPVAHRFPLRELTPKAWAGVVMDGPQLGHGPLHTKWREENTKKRVREFVTAVQQLPGALATLSPRSLRSAGDLSVLLYTIAAKGLESADHEFAPYTVDPLLASWLQERWTRRSSEVETERPVQGTIDIEALYATEITLAYDPASVLAFARTKVVSYRSNQLGTACVAANEGAVHDLPSDALDRILVGWATKREIKSIPVRLHPVYPWSPVYQVHISGKRDASRVWGWPAPRLSTLGAFMEALEQIPSARQSESDSSSDRRTSELTDWYFSWVGELLSVPELDPDDSSSNFNLPRLVNRLRHLSRATVETADTRSLEANTREFLTIFWVVFDSEEDLLPDIGTSLVDDLECLPLDEVRSVRELLYEHLPPTTTGTKQNVVRAFIEPPDPTRWLTFLEQLVPERFGRAPNGAVVAARFGFVPEDFGPIDALNRIEPVPGRLLRMNAHFLPVIRELNRVKGGKANTPTLTVEPGGITINLGSSTSTALWVHGGKDGYVKAFHESRPFVRFPVPFERQEIPAPNGSHNSRSSRNKAPIPASLTPAIEVGAVANFSSPTNRPLEGDFVFLEHGVFLDSDTDFHVASRLLLSVDMLVGSSVAPTFTVPPQLRGYSVPFAAHVTYLDHEVACLVPWMPPLFDRASAALSFYRTFTDFLYVMNAEAPTLSNTAVVLLAALRIASQQIEDEQTVDFDDLFDMDSEGFQRELERQIGAMSRLRSPSSRRHYERVREWLTGEVPLWLAPEFRLFSDDAKSTLRCLQKHFTPRVRQVKALRDERVSMMQRTAFARTSFAPVPVKPAPFRKQLDIQEGHFGAWTELNSGFKVA